MSRDWIGKIITSLAIAIQAVATPARAQEPPRLAEAPNVLQKPGAVPFTEGLVRALRVPPGFIVNVFAAPKGTVSDVTSDHAQFTEVERPYALYEQPMWHVWTPRTSR